MKPYKIILVLLLVVAAFLGGYHTARIKQNLITESDTIIRIDTIRDSIPYPILETQIELIPEPFPEYIYQGKTIYDTIYINLPHVQREYLSKDYHAFVSGYKPSLDSIEVYTRTEYINNTVYIKPRKWGIGVIAGYGIGRDGLSSYLGIGCYYRIW